MKKNILTIIILAATLINVTLTAVMLFVFVPNVKQSNALITKVAQVVDLELESVVIVEEEEKIDIIDTDIYTFKEPMTINLKNKEGDSKKHYAVVEGSLTMNKKSEDYSKLRGLVETYEDQIREVVYDEVGKYTIDDVLTSKDAIKSSILKRIQEDIFYSNFIFNITFSTFTVE